MPVRDFKELLTMEFKDAKSYMGNGVLPQGGKMLLCGPAGYGKSTMVTNLAYDLACGWDGWGHPKLNVIKPLRVLYMENENGEPRLQELFKGMHEAKKGPDCVFENFYTLSKDCPRLENEHPNEEIWMKYMCDIRPDVIILDPLVTFHHSRENEVDGMKHILDNIDKWTLQAKKEYELNPSWIITHHYNKRKNDEGPLSMDRVRGSSRITDWPDTRILMDNKHECGVDGVMHHYRVISFAVIRQGPAIDDMCFWVDACKNQTVPVLSHDKITEVGTPFG